MSLKDAEDLLAGLEKHKHAAARSNYMGFRSETLMHMHSDDPAEAARHRAEMERHFAQRDASLKAHADSGVTTKQIDVAAQAVLDAREIA